MRIANIILYRKNRVQPETIQALQDAIDSGRDVTMIQVDDSELDAFTVLQVTTKEVKAMAPPAPAPPPEPEAPPSPSDEEGEDAMRAALEAGTTRVAPAAAAKKGAAKKAAAAK